MAKKKIENLYKEEILVLEELNNLNSDEQFEVIKNTLNIMYEDKLEITKGMVLKCLKLTLAKTDDYLYLAQNLVVEKTDKEIIFSFQKHGNKLPLIILLVGVLFVALFSATYSGIVLIEKNKINIDIDGDGIPDINLDIDDDGYADINIDLNKDKKPDLNIDYKGNKKAIFALDKNNTGKPNFNLVNDAQGEKAKICKLNCDTNGDGWPDYNYDIDGDGTPDFDIDTNSDGIPDLNLDLNGDLICDAMCDTNGDGKCDTKCIEPESGIKGSGPSNITGDPSGEIRTGYLSVIYESEGDFLVDNLFPDDQTGVVPKNPVKTFRIINNSEYTVIYKLFWVVSQNTFTSENFKYKIESTNNGYAMLDYETAPWEDVSISNYVTIDPKAIQEYTINFKLQGINDEQNYDQGKVFGGHIKVGD